MQTTRQLAEIRLRDALYREAIGFIVREKGGFDILEAFPTKIYSYMSHKGIFRISITTNGLFETIPTNALLQHFLDNGQLAVWNASQWKPFLQ